MDHSTWDIDFRETASYKAAVCALSSPCSDKTVKEHWQYADDAFPLEVRTVVYKYLIDHTVNCHWHNDFEFGVVLEGAVDCYINDTRLKLVKGDVYFVNSSILHMSTQAEQGVDAVMFTLTFRASLLSTNINSSLYAKYVQPLTQKRVEGFKIAPDSPDGYNIWEYLTEIYTLDSGEYGYELECLALFHRLWLTTLRFMDMNQERLLYRNNNLRHSERMKEILSYIHAHYHEKITADHIANHVSISRGECFRCFKHYMNKTIVEYVNEYRLQRAAALLRETEKRLIDISAECGFDSAGYFSKCFKNAYSMSPLQYRKALIWTGNTMLHTNAYDYEYWKDSGNGTMVITANANNGSFSCEWHDIGDIMFRSGKKFGSAGKTHEQAGQISIQFDAAYTSAGCAYLCIYGWTVDPLVEWYIVECYSGLKPPIGAPCLGTGEMGGGTYEFYCKPKVSQPSILGVADFSQYWSVRTSNRLSGTVDVSAHLRAWESTGLVLGRMAEVALSVEAWQSSGYATVHTNVLTIEPSGG